MYCTISNQKEGLLYLYYLSLLHELLWEIAMPRPMNVIDLKTAGIDRDAIVRDELIDELLSWLEPQTLPLLKQKMYRKLISLRSKEV